MIVKMRKKRRYDMLYPKKIISMSESRMAVGHGMKFIETSQKVHITQRFSKVTRICQLWNFSQAVSFSAIE